MHNYLGLDKLNKLNKVAKYYRDHQNEVPKKFRSLQPGGDRHEWIIPQTFKQCKEIIFATGVNVYLIDPTTGTILTGHIDLLARIGNDIIICDYKPRLNLDLSIDNITDVFMDSVPQIAVYGLVFEAMFGKDFGNKYNLYCYTYNKDEGHIYKPLPALWTWKKAYKDFIHPNNPEPLPWEFLISDEVNYEWWDKYY